MINKKNIFIAAGIALSIVLIFAIYFTYLYIDNKQYTERFFPGVNVNDVDISSKTIEEAEELIDLSLKENATYVLKNGEKQWEIGMGALAQYDIKTTLEEIIKEQQELGFVEASKMRKAQRDEPKIYSVEFTLKGQITTLLEEIKQEFDTLPVDAKFVISNDKKVSITPHQNGTTVDITDTMANIDSALQENIYESHLVFKEIEPEMLTSDLEDLQVKDHLFSVETSYGGTGGNRIFNIQLAASKVKNILLLPGDEFSFNKIVGQASKANGYKESTVIINGQFVPGYGGGVCQVSSNIYVGALRANLEILQRRNHGRPVSYLPKGLDATIAYPSTDLRFKNNTPYGVIINTVPTSTHLIVDFYSYKTHYPTVRFESIEEVIPFQTEQKNNPNLKAGEKNVIQQGAPGYRVSTYRISTHNGNTTRELISQDTYRAVNHIVEIGTKPASTGSSTGEVDDDSEDE